jgi:tRNA/rRNA methyltransferase
MTAPAVSVVLVEPQGALNIGSVCRVMMNFGFADLRLVKPRADHLSKQARDMAVNARDLLKNAGLFGTLAEALADCGLCLGTTRRFGKYRQDQWRLLIALTCGDGHVDRPLQHAVSL